MVPIENQQYSRIEKHILYIDNEFYVSSSFNNPFNTDLALIILSRDM